MMKLHISEKDASAITDSSIYASSRGYRFTWNHSVTILYRMFENRENKLNCRVPLGLLYKSNGKMPFIVAIYYSPDNTRGTNQEGKKMKRLSGGIGIGRSTHHMIILD
ncbi:MAG: hypothetical protein ACOWWR_14905 [Eubacteriales bacterium]